MGVPTRDEVLTERDTDPKLKKQNKTKQQTTQLFLLPALKTAELTTLSVPLVPYEATGNSPAPAESSSSLRRHTGVRTLAHTRTCTHTHTHTHRHTHAHTCPPHRNGLQRKSSAPGGRRRDPRLSGLLRYLSQWAGEGSTAAGSLRAPGGGWLGCWPLSPEGRERQGWFWGL